MRGLRRFTVTNFVMFGSINSGWHKKRKASDAGGY